MDIVVGIGFVFAVLAIPCFALAAMRRRSERSRPGLGASLTGVGTSGWRRPSQEVEAAAQSPRDQRRSHMKVAIACDGNLCLNERPRDFTAKRWDLDELLNTSSTLLPSGFVNATLSSPALA